jgi:hypothetical protein
MLGSPLVLFMALAALVACGGDGSRQEVTAEWLPDSQFPSNLVDGTQPAQDPNGVKHSVASCGFDEELVYRVNVDNPYPVPLKAIIANSLNGEGGGGIWGFFSGEIPPRRSTVIIDTGDLPDRKRQEFFGKTLPEIQADFDIVGCSAHLLGFFEGPEYKVAQPVAYRYSVSGNVPATSVP